MGKTMLGCVLIVASACAPNPIADCQAFCEECSEPEVDCVDACEEADDAYEESRELAVEEGCAPEFDTLYSCTVSELDCELDACPDEAEAYVDCVTGD